MGKVNCSKCGQELTQDDWNPEVFLLFCENSSCILFKRPQAKKYKDHLGKAIEPPKGSLWLLNTGLSLVERGNRYAWVPTRLLRASG
jgi:late competence protein required for DNA uptake (superfamily II DNA/RNA helicase)